MIFIRAAVSLSLNQRIIMKASLRYAVIALCCVVSTACAQIVPDTVLKIHIKPLQQPLRHLTQLHPVSYEYNTHQFKQMSLPQGLQFGFMADDMERVYPHLVKTRYGQWMYGKNVYRNVAGQTVEQSSLIPVLVGAIKELNAEVEKLKDEIRELKKKHH